jgi:uncharacterized UBP type Zn finger protein
LIQDDIVTWNDSSLNSRRKKKKKTKGRLLTQEDAADFFMTLMEKLPAEITTSISGRQTIHRTCRRCNGRHSDNQPPSVPLVVGIHLNPDVSDLEVGLEQALAMGHVEGTCALCHAPAQLGEEMEFEYNGNEAMIFRLMRFSFDGTGRKITRHISFPLIHEEEYHLNSIIVHQGRGLDSGHYFAMVKSGKQWYKIDDATVSRVTENKVLRQKAYLLFYNKVNKAEDHEVEDDDHEVEAEDEEADDYKPVGIKNKDNSCFINATLQSLANLPSFVRDFGECDDRGEYGDLLEDVMVW